MTYVLSVSANLDRKPISETPFGNWPVWVSDMISRPGKWKTMLASARSQGWRDDPSDDFGEDALECGNIDRSGAPVAFTAKQSTSPECSKFFKRGPKAVATH